MNKNTLLTVLVTVVVFVGGFALGRTTSETPLPTFMTGQNTSETADNNTSGTNDVQSTDQTGNATSVPLTDGQRKMLAAFGIDPNTVEITPAMVACAEAKLGAARIEEIKGGATPSMSEGISLMACYK